MGDRRPLVSVVVPTYRRVDLLLRAVRSVLAQTYKNVEVIIVDDASPDSAQYLIDGINDGRIRYLRHDKNVGASASRNTGIRAAAGKYIAFLDDDDEWQHSKLERQVEFLETRDCDAVLCRAYINCASTRGHRKAAVTLDDLRRGNEFAPGSGLVVRASLMKRILFDESLASGEDWDALIQIAKNSRTTTIGYLNEPLFNVNDGAHLRTTNKTRDLSREELERRMVVIRKNRSFFGEFLFNQHVAAYLLSYFSSRKGKLNHLAYTIGRCGVAPVAVVLARKAERQLSAFIGRRRTRARSSAKE